MELAPALVVLALVVLAWKLSAFLLGVLSWVALGFVALSLAVGVSVPAAAIVGTVGLWLASQGVSRVRNGSWRSGLLRGLCGLVSAGRAAAS